MNMNENKQLDMQTPRDRGNKGKNHVEIKHGECVTCTKFTGLSIGLIPVECHERFHTKILAECRGASFNEKYAAHPLTPTNIMLNGCPEYEELQE